MKKTELVRALYQLDQLLANKEIDGYTRISLNNARRALTLMPMNLVLDAVPGDHQSDKARAVRVSRNTWYLWRTGYVRPNSKQAARIAQLTGIPVEKFAGRR